MILRNILAVVAGAFGAGLTIAMVEYAGHALVSSDATTGLFVIVAIGYGLGAVVASGLANRITPSPWPAVVACLILAGLAASNLFLIAHPIWFLPVAGALMFGGFMLGRLGRGTVSGKQS